MSRRAAFGDGGDVDVLIEDLDVAVGLDHAGGHNARLVGAQIQRLGTVAIELERDLLEVQDDVGCVFDNAADRLELVQHVFDADGGNCGAFDRAEQSAAQGVADGGAEAALKGLGAELAKLLGKRLGIDCQALRLLKSSPQHWSYLFLRGDVRREAFCGGRAGSPSGLQFQVVSDSTACSALSLAALAVCLLASTVRR